MFDESFFDMYNAEEESSGSGTVQQQQSQVQESVEKKNFDPAKTYVISVGGSIISQDKPITTYIAKLSETIQKLQFEGFNFVLVAGGGKLARSYISSVKTLGANAFYQDLVGIHASRLNALLLIEAVSNTFPKVVTQIEDVKTIIEAGKIPVLGGLLPGITTDCVSALTAEFLEATFVNLSNVDGVYSSDPNENPRAKFYPEISYNRLLSLMKLHSSKPGQNIILDLPSCLIIARSKVLTLILDGTDLENVEAAIRGQEFKGTIVGDFEQVEETD